MERASALFFRRLQADVDQPRELPSETYDDAISFNIDQTRARIRTLDNQLRSNIFSDKVEHNARVMLEAVGLAIEEIDAHLGMLARQLAAKAERDQMRYFEHQLLRPEQRFRADDPTFEESHPAQQPVILETLPAPSLSIEDLIGEHVAFMQDQGQGASHINEFRRVGRWLIEEFGAERSVASISTVMARDFRDKLRRIDAGKRSKVKDGEKSLSSNLTDDRERQIRSDTAGRYWSYVRALFRRAVSEGYLSTDPASSLAVPIRRDEERKSPEPYSTAELRKFFAMPVFTGRHSKSRQKAQGNYRVRDGYFWSGLLQAYTGMRGGELSQLYPGDFIFDGPLPHILIRKEDAEGKPTKQVKNAASKRAIPISDDLLVLGLRQFVEGRRKQAPTSRIFSEFPLGTGGKVSDGLSKFWRRYIPAFGLHKPGRAVHVWRHTVVYHLRALGVPEEEIGYLIGHSTGSQTSRYGAGELLARVKERSLERLQYGFDVIETVGGPFDPAIHAE